jgi:hypothetical protein
MATYKVPQDVEADDKLIGPFSFRQFIYLIAVVLAGVAAWGLAQIFIGLVIIPLPIIIFFGALALPLRKDQPMEVYMAAMVSFYLKPRKRLWDPEGIETLIEITAPKTYEENRTKNLSQGEAQQRLSYLANIVDSGGWAIRGANAAPNMSINNDVFLEAQGAVDVLDANTSIAQSFNQLMSETSARAKQEAVERMKSTMFAPTLPLATPPTPMQAQMASIIMPAYDPYPTDIQQTVIQPLNDPLHMAGQNIEQVPIATVVPIAPIVPVYTAPTTVQVTSITPVLANPTAKSSTTTSDTPIPADIINLANNADGFSIETIAHEANRIHKKLEEASGEVVISLR